MFRHLYRENQVTQLSPESTEGAAAANRFLYYEFCHQGMVDGLLKQSYAQGWGQVTHGDLQMHSGSFRPFYN